MGKEVVILDTSFTATSDGILLADITSDCDTTFEYQYFLTDHKALFGVGALNISVRVTFADPDTNGVADLLEQHHSYPFALEMEDVWEPGGGAGINEGQHLGKGKSNLVDLG